MQRDDDRADRARSGRTAAVRTGMPAASGGFAALSGALLLAALLGSADPAAAAAGAAESPANAWRAFTADFIEASFRADPYFAVQSGRHEFDGRMPDLSAAGLHAEAQRLHAARAAAQAFDEHSLEPEARLEREHLLQVIDDHLFWIEGAQLPFTSPPWYIGRLDPEVYLERNYAPPAVRLRGYLGYVRSIPKIAGDIRANLRLPLDPTMRERGIEEFSGFATFFRKDVAAAFSTVQDVQQQREFAAGNAAAARSMEELAGWLRGQRAHPGPAFRLGAERYAAMLRAAERVDLPVPRLAAVAQADLERNTQALREACKAFAPKTDLATCIARMDADKPDGGAVEGARGQLQELRSYVVAHGIVGVPSDEQARVAEAPPYNAANFAYINVPGPYDRGVVATYNIAPPNPAWSAAERAAYVPGRAKLRYTSVHEVWPGHFLQFLHSNRSTSHVESLWVTDQFAEGWAHYAEEMMWEEGLDAGQPERHIGQLTEALLRDVRFIASIGLHTGSMSVADAERMFRERAFQDPGNARQQAERGVYDPSYLCYTLGKLIIRRMRTDWEVRHAAPGADPRSTWRAFHDELLAHGGPALPLLRRVMIGEGGELL